MTEAQIMQKYFEQIKALTPEGFTDIRARFQDLVIAGEIMLPPLNGYKAFYKGKECDVWAENTVAARTKAADKMKVRVKEQYMMHVHLCIRADGTEVVHVAD